MPREDPTTVSHLPDNLVACSLLFALFCYQTKKIPVVICGDAGVNFGESMHADSAIAQTLTYTRWAKLAMRDNLMESEVRGTGPLGQSFQSRNGTKTNEQRSSRSYTVPSLFASGSVRQFDGGTCESSYDEKSPCFDPRQVAR